MKRIKCHSCIYYRKRGSDEEGIICTSGSIPTPRTLSSIKWCISYKKASLLERIKRRFR